MLKRIIVQFNLINILSIPLYIFRIFKIKKNRILCVNFSGKGYGDNPKFIVEELLKSEKKYEIIWVVENKNEIFPKSLNVVKIYSFKYFYYLATSKIWINNSRFPLFVKKRKKQFYIQTWHGGVGLKKCEYDAIDNLSEYYKKVMKNDNKMIDLMISNSDFNSNILFRGAMRYKGKILKIGSPRNDILINNPKSLVLEVKNQYKIQTKSKILLYAPTFRNNYVKNPYDIDFDKLKNELEKLTDCKWEIMVKLHPRIKNSDEFLKNYNNIVINASNCSDTQKLISACDILITDYSSTFFEAMLCNKIIILYANDIVDFEKLERGFYFKFNELPFPLATNNEELLKIIKNKETFNISNKYNNFKKKLGLSEDGKASLKIATVIEKIVYEGGDDSV